MSRQSMTGNAAGRDMITCFGSFNEELANIHHIPTQEYFMGRKVELETLKQKLSSIDRVYLCGVGGIGKTSLAYEHARQSKSQVKFRLRFESEDTLESDYKQLARMLDLDIANSDELSCIVPRVNNTLLQRYDSIILIYDNVASFREPVSGKSHLGNLNFFCPKISPDEQARKSFKIIVTSRSKKFNKKKRMILKSFKEKDAQLFFYELYSRYREVDKLNINHKQKFNRFLSKKLCGHPLAISQVVSYLASYPNIGLEAYMKIYKKHPKKALSERVDAELQHDGELPEIRQEVLTTFDVHLDALREMGNMSFDMLTHIAFMSSDEIVKSMLYGKHYENGSQDDLISVPCTSINAFEKEMQQCMLVDISNDKNTVSIHRIVQFVLFSKLKSEERRVIIINLLRFFLSYCQSSGDVANEHNSYDHQFAYLVDGIIKQSLIFRSVQVDDNIVLRSQMVLIDRYKEEGRVIHALFYLSEYLKIVKNHESKSKLIQTLHELLNSSFAPRVHANKELLERIFSQLRLQEKVDVANILLLKEAEMTEEHRGLQKETEYDKSYHNAVHTITSTILNEHISRPENAEAEIHQHTVWLKATRILGRHYREKAKGDITTISKIKSGEISNLAEEKMNQKFHFNYNKAKFYLQDAAKYSSKKNDLFLVYAQLILLNNLQPLDETFQSTMENMKSFYIQFYDQHLEYHQCETYKSARRLVGSDKSRKRPRSKNGKKEETNRDSKAPKLNSGSSPTFLTNMSKSANLDEVSNINDKNLTCQTITS